MLRSEETLRRRKWSTAEKIAEKIAEKTLKDLHEILMQEINLEQSLVSLYSMQKLSEDQYQKLSNPYHTENYRKRCLLCDTMLSRGYKTGYEILCKVLEKNDQISLLTKLQNEYTINESNFSRDFTEAETTTPMIPLDLPRVAIGHPRGHVEQIINNLPEIKLVMLGDSGTGKTSLICQYVYKKFCRRPPTMQVDFKTTVVRCHGTEYQLSIWDTAGMERNDSITRAYYRDALGAFIVYDITSADSQSHCKTWKEKIDSTVCLQNGEPIPVILLANKSDKVGKKIDGQDFSKKNEFTEYFETSAKTGEGIDDAVNYMVEKVYHLSRIGDKLVLDSVYQPQDQSQEDTSYWTWGLSWLYNTTRYLCSRS